MKAKPRKRATPAPWDPNEEIAAGLKVAKKGVQGIAGTTGLAFKKDSNEPGVGSYIVRYRVAGRRPTMGIGAFGKITLADARKVAEEAVRLAHRGIDPIAERDRVKAETRAEQANATIVFEQMVETYLKTRYWRHKRARLTWLNPVRAYAYPTLAGLRLEQIAISHIIAIIEGIEAVKDDKKKRKYARNETARRVVSRVAAVLDSAIALSGKAIRNPADAKLIEKVRPLNRPGPSPHFRRIELSAAPRVFNAIREAGEGAEGFLAVALDAWLLMITCVSRPSEALNARWSEINFGEKLRVIPAAQMKSFREHIVPLSPIALEVLERRRKVSGDGDAVFTGPSGWPIGYSNFSRAPEKAGIDAGCPHSWRSVFSDWRGNKTNFPRELAEFALAHAVPGVAGDYQRESAPDRRRELMTAYEYRLSGDTGAEVIDFRTREGARL